MATDDKEIKITRNYKPLTNDDVDAIRWKKGDSGFIKALKASSAIGSTTGGISSAIQDASDIATSINNIWNFYERIKTSNSYRKEEAKGVKRLKDMSKLIQVFDRSILKVKEPDGYEPRKVIVEMFNHGFPIQNYPEYFEVEKLKVLSHIVAIMIKNNLPLDSYVPRKLSLEKLNKLNDSLIYKYGLPN